MAPTSSRLIGHFGTYGTHVVPILRAAIATLLREDARLSVVCTGGGSDIFVEHLVSAAPSLAERVHATGRVSTTEAAAVLIACDLLLQPYVDGVTTRRTSVMAGLINARPVVTTSGHLTEAVWSETHAVAMAPAGDVSALVGAVTALLADDRARAALAVRGERTYRERFALQHTIALLRATAKGAAA